MDAIFVAPRFDGGRLNRRKCCVCPFIDFVHKLMLSEDVEGFAIVRVYPCVGEEDKHVIRQVALSEESRRFYLHYYAAGYLSANGRKVAEPLVISKKDESAPDQPL